MKIRAVGLLLALCFLPALSHAEEINAGFVQGLWYSSEEVFAGVPTRIYVALRNNTPHDLTGTIRFTDNGTRIGSSEVRALSGRLVEAWVDWNPTSGTHTIAATVSDAELHIIGEGSRPIDITGLVAEDTRTVEYDTDADGIANSIDTDDDNDGVLDTDEQSRGSNPLVPNPKTVTIEKDTVIETAPASSEATSEDAGAERGLEKYIDDGTVDSLLGNVTRKVETAKDSIDTYRAKRNESLYSAPVASSTARQDGTATITRATVPEKQNIMTAFVTGVASIFKNVWTFILWGVSRALTYPALMQFLLLLSILYLCIRTMRRLARRPNMPR